MLYYLSHQGSEEKTKEPEIKLPASHQITEKAREFKKNIYCCFSDYAKTFNCVDHNKLWKSLQQTGIPDHLTCLWETSMQVKKQQLELDWFQIGKGVCQGSILSLCLFNLYAEFSSVTQPYPNLCNPMDYRTPGFPVHYQLLELAQTHGYQVSDAIQPSHPLLSPFPPAFFLSISIFSNESVLSIWLKWPKYWSFSFSNSPSNEYSGLISFRMDSLDLLTDQGTLKSLSNTTVQKHQFFSAQLYL